MKILLFAILMTFSHNLIEIPLEMNDKKWTKKVLQINQDTTIPAKISFTVKEDNTSVYIGADGINNFLINFYHLDKPDVYGKTQWKVNRQSGVFLHRTYLDKGDYSFTVVGRTHKPTYKFRMIVNIQQEKSN